MNITSKLKAHLRANKWIEADASDKDIKEIVSEKLTEGSLSPDQLAELTKAAPTVGSGNQKTTSPLGSKLYGGAGSSSIRIKGEKEKYDTERVQLKHAKTGAPVVYDNRPFEGPSELDMAKAGVWFRWQMRRQGANIGRPLSEHEKGLLIEMFEDDVWVGEDHPSKGLTNLFGMESKAILDDTNSGGDYLVPEVFDQAVITFPLLFGELFPMVEVIDVEGRQIETASVGNPTVTWGNAEGTSLSLFNTASLIAEITGTVFPVQVLVEMGRDMLADSPVAVASIVQQNIGQRMQSTLDEQIAIGDGTTEPQGITNASGLTSVNSDNGAGGPPTVSDYEALMFAIAKQYRQQAWNNAFIANDTSYRRARGIAVSGTDQRRIFGMDEQSYMLLEHPYKVQNDIGNSSLIFGALKKYRMWRRTGFEVRYSEEGQTLMQKNTALLSVRGRFGGKVVDSNAFALMSDGQA